MNGKQDGPRPLLVEIPILIQPYHIDFANHVNNTVYVRWLEDLRMAMLRAHCPLRELMDRGLAPVVASAAIQYKKPLRLFDAPVGRMWCAEMGRATMTVEAEIVVDGAVCTTAEQRLIMVNMTEHKPMRMPEGLRKAFAAAVNAERGDG